MNPVQHILVLGVRLYRWVLSPAKMVLFGPQAGCRFTPSCSEYALQAVQTHGALSGSWLAVKRLCRCHPWGDCGHDPLLREKFEVRSSKFEFQDLISATVSSQGPAVSYGWAGRHASDCQFPVAHHVSRITHLHGP